ncbi:MAG: radical SAM protein [Candidatus Omnitrophica bacterium]|nr:radical SAM protein [Candidatus Omnitrophota bacterium]
MQNINIKNDLQRLKGIRADKVLTGPRSVSIGISRECNLSCKYCLGRPFDDFKPLKKEERSPFITMADFIKIVEDCSLLGVEHITLCGGEPTLHPDIRQMIAWIIKKKMRVSLNTNGTFNADLRKVLQSVTALNINVAATSHEDYRRLQGGGREVFNRVLRNIKALAGNKRISRQPLINIVYVLNNSNVEQAGEIIALAEKIGADSVQFKIMRFNKGLKDLAILEPDARKLKEIVQKIVRNGEYRQVKTNLRQICRVLLDSRFSKDCETENFYGMFEGGLYFSRAFKKDFKCYYGWFSADIGPWGHVFLCCTNRLTYIGNIYEDPFKKIWNSRYAHKIRLAMKNKFEVNRKFWKPCHYCSSISFNTAVGSFCR